MLQTKFVIEMTHCKANGNYLTYYYKGQDKVGYNRFDTRKSTAKKYDRLEEADRDMRILTAVHSCKSDTFKVVTIRCRT